MSVIEATVPIIELPEVFIIFPILISVVKEVPEPVTFGDVVEVVMVPVRLVFGHAVALQFPEALLVILAPFIIPAKNIKNNVRYFLII